MAGAIAGHGSGYYGVAPGASIVSAGTGGYSASLTYDRRIIAAADWAIAPSGGDADIVNTSLVQDTATGAEEARRYFDSLVDQDGRLSISAAGNYVNFNGWQIGSPGTGYNVLTVGGVNDRGTAGRQRRPDLVRARLQWQQLVRPPRRLVELARRLQQAEPGGARGRRAHGQRAGCQRHQRGDAHRRRRGRPAARQRADA